MKIKLIDIIMIIMTVISLLLNIYLLIDIPFNNIIPLWLTSNVAIITQYFIELFTEALDLSIDENIIYEIIVENDKETNVKDIKINQSENNQFISSKGIILITFIAITVLGVYCYFQSLDISNLQADNIVLIDSLVKVQNRNNIIIEEVYRLSQVMTYNTNINDNLATIIYNLLDRLIALENENIQLQQQIDNLNEYWNTFTN